MAPAHGPMVRYSLSRFNHDGGRGSIKQTQHSSRSKWLSHFERDEALTYLECTVQNRMEAGDR